MKKAMLILENNLVLRGKGVGAYGCFYGELVFNTGMTGYMESLTDPSYAGQIVTFAYPLIGNCGATFKWSASNKFHPTAVVVSEIFKDPEHKDTKTSLDELLSKNGIGGISDIDTRALVKLIRKKGTIPAVVSVYENPNINLIDKVTSKEIQVHNPKGTLSVALIDYGVKKGIIQELIKHKLKVIVFPATISAKEILSYHPKGIVLSNGPGDPKDFPEIHKIIKELIDSNIPILGICLGHQFLALADGAKIYKLKFGHHGLNHPVIDKETDKAYLTSQNHGYVVDKTTLPKQWGIRFINLNDGTIEGLIHKTKPFISVQFHPEANPGPYDTNFVFDQFTQML